MATMIPASRSPLSPSNLQLHPLGLIPPFYPPSTHSSEPALFWPAMPSPAPPTPPPQQQQRVNNGRGGRKASNSSAAAGKKKNAPSGGLQFITVSKPEGFKDKDVMTKVRKKAMSHHLEETAGKAHGKGGLKRETSTASIASTNSRTDATTDVPTVSTSESQRALSITSHENSDSTRSSVSANLGPNPTFQVVVRSKPLITPSRHVQDNGEPLPYDTYPMPLLQSLGKALDPFQTMFQASHSSVNVERLKYECSAYYGTKALGRFWIPTALSHPHTFLGSLCLASAYNDMVRNEPQDSLPTIALRQEVIHIVSQNMTDSTKAAQDPNLMAVIQLIISEIIGREEAPLKYHEDGIETMIKSRGGLSQLGLHGRLASSISWVSLTSSMFREEPPRQIYSDYCATHSKCSYPSDATAPVSPLYCPAPRHGFQALNEICSPRTVPLLQDIKTMIDQFLQESKELRQARRNSSSATNPRMRILDSSIYPVTEHSATGVNEWRYEAIRITAVILATAIIDKMPLSEAVRCKNKSSLSLFTSAHPSTSHDSPVSPLTSRDQFITETPTSSAGSFYDSNYASQLSQNPFNFSVPNHRPSESSINTHRSSDASSITRASFSTTMTRPSLTGSMYSTSSDSLSLTAYPMAPPPRQSTSESLLQDLRHAIEKSNMSKCWEDMAGVLFWIGLVGGVAVKKKSDKSLRRFFSAITMRTGVVICFEHPEAVNATVLRMTEVTEALNLATATPDPSQKRYQKRARV